MKAYPEPTTEEIATWRALSWDSAEAWADRLNEEIDRTGTSPREQLEAFDERCRLAPKEGIGYVIDRWAHIPGEQLLAGVPVSASSRSESERV